MKIENNFKSMNYSNDLHDLHVFEDITNVNNNKLGDGTHGSFFLVMVIKIVRSSYYNIHKNDIKPPCIAHTFVTVDDGDSDNNEEAMKFDDDVITFSDYRAIRNDH